MGDLFSGGHSGHALLLVHERIIEPDDVLAVVSYDGVVVAVEYLGFGFVLEGFSHGIGFHGMIGRVAHQRGVTVSTIVTRLVLFDAGEPQDDVVVF